MVTDKADREGVESLNDRFGKGCASFSGLNKFALP